MIAMTTAFHGVMITLFHPLGFEVTFFGIYCWKFLRSFHLISLLKSVNKVDVESTKQQDTHFEFELIISLNFLLISSLILTRKKQHFWCSNKTWSFLFCQSLRGVHILLVSLFDWSIGQPICTLTNSFLAGQKKMATLFWPTNVPVKETNQKYMDASLDTKLYKKTKDLCMVTYR